MPEIPGADPDYNPHHNMSNIEMKEVRMESADFTTGQLDQVTITKPRKRPKPVKDKDEIKTKSNARNNNRNTSKLKESNAVPISQINNQNTAHIAE